MTVTPATVGTAPEEAPFELPRPTELAEVKGWFFPIDQVLFDFFLSRQLGREEPGDLLEVGAYMGKSAIFTGSYLRGGDTFTVCDLFDAPAEDSANSQEMQRSYSTLTRDSFEANYLSFHDELPVVIQGLSSLVGDRVTPKSVRFAHIDASHLYEHVHGDIEISRDLVHPYGVVALDDFRAEHCPGVAAAAWEAVTSGGLNVICVTGTKMYATWGDATEIREDLLAFVRGREDFWHGVEEVAGAPLIRIKEDRRKTVAPAQPASRHPKPVPAPAPAPAAVKAPAPAAAVRAAKPRRSPLRRFVVNVLPPFITKGLLRIRDTRRQGA